MGNDTKHTPGPWEHWSSEVAGGVISEHGTVCRGTNEANGRLIAAAPEMLEALRRARDVMEHDEQMDLLSPQMEDALRRARAAIAKAEGRENAP